ncbi:PLD nuclease N-terminal domain-containing protein [Streptomyces caniscabiei]|uniref:PLDc_N domain-containing protein n=1 Tax=Streptomyces caniscabiei TaxID=2746961 RepID=A0A927L9J0_9ACTN|nr:PLD nuclease N-terminal domain-containing protein [Streptomyces caniscabiei]MBD9703074.1 PLDc_N domain-containing protein [Streptomyces caniscabiei]MBD9727593.1 PLDc_N domain-containing protein [Streptomyces caniscabiei]MDX3512997.1 PLD nuclease N-terminal domain-containing protein [Streptomyces caniscabiei]MDX3722035.1 PLD nuclease N-terminal domain-containing protein [Streptomyces caniscabiei]MDX3732256.1 PLD nuclease N-terminal domain-containing protein [Streptomyces caniscabiei]
MLRLLMYLVPLALTIYAFIDCLNTPEDEAKHLPKIAWVFIILLFWIVGPIAWLAAGKLRNAPAGGRTPSEWHRNHRTDYVAPDDNPEFLKSLAEDNKKDESLLKSWEADLRRREEELKQQEQERGEKGGQAEKREKKDGEEA